MKSRKIFAALSSGWENRGHVQLKAKARANSPNQRRAPVYYNKQIAGKFWLSLKPSQQWQTALFVSAEDDN
jgi:hypothetical protein